VLPAFNCDWEEDDLGLSAGGGTGGGGEGVRVGRGRALSLSACGKLEDLPVNKPFRRWFALRVLLLVGGIDGPAREFEFEFEPVRGSCFSVTTVSSIPVGVPTFFRADSFWCKYLASASNLREAKDSKKKHSCFINITRVNCSTNEMRTSPLPPDSGVRSHCTLPITGD